MISIVSRVALAAAFSTVSATLVTAQDIKLALRPGPTQVRVSRGIEYGRADTVRLHMDVYRPADAGARRLPTLVFFNRGFGAGRNQPFYVAWARAAASRGIVAILPDLRGGSEPADFQLLATHLAARGAEVGVDKDAIVVFSGSGNVNSAFPVVEDPKMTSIGGAVMYYGTGPVTEFRLDLPVLYVRAGLDRPEVNKEIMALAALAASQNAPVTLLNHSTGYHAFEMFNDDDATRDVMEQTLSFVRRVTSPGYQASLREGIPEARAAGYVQLQAYAKAAPIYAGLVAKRPDDARLRLSYGEALLGAERYGEACAEMEKLKGKPLGPRDLGLPAARACMLKGDADAAIAWLKTIPTRFLPPQIATEPAFAPIKDRADFKALFPAR
ncbi:MAG TPA: hypothetical protein VM076_01840 [Gemmatimonadaceae bacterium]|nr:hypothetical protein [Gemmatimonadaceae bacterium]